MKVFSRTFPLVFLLFLSSCAMVNEWEQAKRTDEAYQQCLERHGNDPGACADHRAGAQRAQQQYEEKAKDLFCNQGGYPDPCQGPTP